MNPSISGYRSRTYMLVIGFALVFSVCLSGSSVRAQFGEVPFEENPFEIKPSRVIGLPLKALQQGAAPVQEEQAKAQDESEDEPEEESEAGLEEEQPQPAEAAEKLDPRAVRFHLLDGSVISGNLNVDKISVATDFGELSIPVEKIKAFRPGLNSYSDIRTNLDNLVEQLGSDEYNTRQNAHRKLSALGLKIKDVIRQYKDSGNAERKRHLEEIRKEIQELEEELDEDDERDFDERPWIDGDEIVTDSFTIVGKIKEDQFSVESKYGELKVALQDVSFGDRPSISKPEITRSVTVNGTNIAQQNFKSTNIRVQEGDVVTIRAEGQVVMTPWGSDEFSTPDGAANYGWYIAGQIEGGALVGKIGSNGKVFKIGSKKRFVCKTSGVLQLAVGVNPDYANGYSYPGQYSVKLKVTPK